ncbi:hypothetical protein CONCODRAFT_69976 [Conidiobolus coronatus NRRL 28638]|uniref:Uncharacterized protein n=1 Tax=Conidiobolus coronatus (strain ATCC 28846 / CBS 209.66 / NRRL 28638) TaxID=796925 RepID=A0A137P8D6_CONC2|nr:hypothetical protein CONCODRAFT_69976 [Conidiobolus coronatus NRRL 28638]|eukprot:KXN71242.1 hypothetical protein CONCODRAFT_69976 [Conidiobolus coronatus NRRL 28638]
MNFINSPFTNTDISALSSLGSFIQYNYTMIANTIPLSQPFTTDELSTIDSFASTLIPSSGKSSFVTLANSLIEFFTGNNDITSKVVANGVAIGKMYPNIINSASSLFTTMINYVKQKGMMEKLKLYGFYKQYKSQYSGYYSKASALVDKFSSAFPSLKNTPSLI